MWDKKLWLLLGGVVISLLMLWLLPTVFLPRQAGPYRAVRPTPTPSEKPVLLFAVPSTGEVSVGENFTIEVHIDTRDQRINGAHLELVYDPSIVTVTTVTQGNFFANPIIYANKNDSEKGELLFALGSFEEKQGTGVIAKLTLAARKKTQATAEILTIKPTSIIISVERKEPLSSEQKGAFIVIR